MCLPENAQHHPTLRRAKTRRSGGFTLVEMLVGASVLCVVAIASTQAMVLSNRWAAVNRLRTNARAVVQRNIDEALAVPFSATQSPTILAITPGSGLVYDDDGNGDNLVQVMVQETGGTVLVPGTLTRIVTTVANQQTADIRRITFRLAYTFRGQPYTYQMETLRTRD